MLVIARWCDGLGETIADTAVREVEEETGIAFIAEGVRGEPRTSDESSEVEWIDPDAYEIHPSMRQRINRFCEAASEPYRGSPAKAPAQAADSGVRRTGSRPTDRGSPSVVARRLHSSLAPWTMQSALWPR